MRKIQLLVRPYKQMIGLARYTASLCQALTKAGISYSLATPTATLPVRLTHRLLAPLGLDARAFFTNYPLSAPLARDAITHLTVQQMAFILWLRPLHPVAVTVHDIVPFLVRHDPGQNTLCHPFHRLFEWLAMLGLKRADVLISDSEFTKKTLVETLGCQAERIVVVPLGVNHETFRPQPAPDEEFYSRYRLDRQSRHVLYVGSENPRKNLTRLIDAFARLHETLPDVRLIKIGSIEYPRLAAQLRRQVRQLGLADAVLFTSPVPDQELASFYNVADLFVFPSLYEGFGLPPLEAMACGAPVVCSNAASLPEVVGDAAITVDPYDVDGLTEAMVRVLTDADLRRQLRERGLARARQFTWERTALETIAVYRQMDAS